MDILSGAFDLRSSEEGSDKQLNRDIEKLRHLVSLLSKFYCFNFSLNIRKYGNH